MFYNLSEVSRVYNYIYALCIIKAICSVYADQLHRSSELNGTETKPSLGALRCITLSAATKLQRLVFCAFILMQFWFCYFANWNNFHIFTAGNNN